MIFAMLLAALGTAAAADLSPAIDRSTPPITIVYPPDHASLGHADGEFVTGSVSDPKALFQINGTTVSVYRNGAFLAWIPVTPGTFTFNAALRQGTTVQLLQREVSVAVPPAPLPGDPLSIDKDTLAPRFDVELRSGDWLLTRMKVSPGASGQFRLGRRGAWQPMREANPALGILEGAYVVTAEDETEGTPVEFRARSGRGMALASSPGRVTILKTTPGIVVVRGQGTAMVKTGPGEGDLFPALGGTRFVAGGKYGNETKLLLSAGQTGWIDSKNLELLLPGAHPPRAETDAVTVKTGDNSTIVHIGLGDRVPFIIEESDDLSTLTVRFHYAYLHTNWIVYNEPDGFVDEIRLKQETSDIVAVTIRLKPARRLWGYWPSFEGNALRLELKHPPRLAKRGSPLSGVRVFIDPGHMPSAAGATGPLGTREMDVNYAIARSLERLLLKDGAVPLMSRASADDEVGLSERPKMALDRKADVFISVHNNNLVPGKNPFKGAPHGYSIFYYHPHSLELARSVFAAYGKNVPLPPEGLRFGNLLVCRLSAIPSILTESAYLTYPEQEALLLDEKFRNKLAQGIVDGLSDFLKGVREAQR